MSRTVFETEDGGKIVYDQVNGETIRSALSTVRVNRNFRICYRGKVYKSGEIVDLPLLLACEWSCWGSVSPVRTKKVTQ